MQTTTKKPYDRAAQLKKLVGALTYEIDDMSLDGCRRAFAVLYRALRSERNRGAYGHHTYDVVRHMALVDAIRHERELIDALHHLEQLEVHIRKLRYVHASMMDARARGIRIGGSMVTARDVEYEAETVAQAERILHVERTYLAVN